MKGIKNSLKKIRLSLTFRDSVQTIDESHVDKADVDAIKQNYRDKSGTVVHFKGYDFPDDAVHSRVLENIEDLEVREDDIYLVSYPATNCHLLEDIVHILLEKEKSVQQKSQKENSEQQNQIVEDVQINIARLEVSNPYI